MSKRLFLFLGVLATTVVGIGSFFILKSDRSGDAVLMENEFQLAAVITLGEEKQNPEQKTVKEDVLQQEVAPAEAENFYSPELSVQTEPEQETQNIEEPEPLQQDLTEMPVNSEPPLEIAEKEEIQQTEEIVQTELVSMPLCGFVTNQAPSHQKAIMNEIAWMGSANSVNDEWIELKNISGGELDISGWQIWDMNEQIQIIFEKGVKIEDFYLLERTDDDSVPGISADKIYKGALSNVGEGLRLFDSNCALIDEALAAPDWPAGDNNFKKTMERDADLSWRNYSGDGQNGIYGTPRSENSPGEQPINQSSGGFVSATVSQQQSSEPVGAESEPEPENQPVLEPELPKILISEIQAGTANGVDDEFVELYNPTDQTIDLNGWALKKKTGSGTEYNLVNSGAFSGQILPHSFFLIAHKNYAGAKQADLIYSANSNNLAYKNNSVVLYDFVGTIMDETGWEEIPKEKSLERKALENEICVSSQNEGELKGNGCDGGNPADFELREVPEPQNSQDFPEPI